LAGGGGPGARASPQSPVRRRDPFLLVIEAIEKPGNLGTILRSADAAGIGAVIVCDPVTDLFNPNVVRSSTGVLFRCQSWWRQSEVRACWALAYPNGATAPGAQALYTDSDLRGPLALIMAASNTA